MDDTHAGAPRSKEFLASHGGPFYELQRRLKLLHDHALMSGRRAVLFIGIAGAGRFFLGCRKAFPSTHQAV